MAKEKEKAYCVSVKLEKVQIVSRSIPDFDEKIPWGGNFTEKAHLEENGLQNFERMSLFHGTRSCLQFTSTAYQIP